MAVGYVGPNKRLPLKINQKYTNKKFEAWVEYSTDKNGGTFLWKLSIMFRRRYGKGGNCVLQQKVMDPCPTKTEKKKTTESQFSLREIQEWCSWGTYFGVHQSLKQSLLGY